IAALFFGRHPTVVGTDNDDEGIAGVHTVQTLGDRRPAGGLPVLELNVRDAGSLEHALRLAHVVLQISPGARYEELHLSRRAGVGFNMYDPVRRMMPCRVAIRLIVGDLKILAFDISPANALARLTSSTFTLQSVN